MAELAVTPNAKAPLNEHYHDSDAVEKSMTATPKYDDLDGPRKKKFLFWSLTKKQWIWALVGSIVGVLAVVLLILFLAVVPAIFQGQVDKVVLTANHMDLLKLSPSLDDKTISVELSVNIQHDSMAAATMKETKAKLSYKGSVFGEVTLPETKLEKGKHSFDLVIKGSSEIIDVNAFYEVSKAVMTEDDFEISASAEVEIKALGLSYGGLELKRTLKVKGLDQFSNPASIITGIAVESCSATEYKMLNNITLENDSSIGLDGIGRLNLSVAYKGQYMGQAVSIDGIGIPRGQVKKRWRLTVQQTAGPLKALKAFLTDLVGGVKDPQVVITGANDDAVSEAVLLTPALAKLNMTGTLVDGIRNVNLNFPTGCTSLLALLA